jgi:hypothetical protein
MRDRVRPPRHSAVVRVDQPEPIESPIWNYVVLLIAFVSDSYSWTVACRLLRASRDEPKIFGAAKASKDASTFTIWFEDSAAVLGVVVAFVGVLLSHLLGSPYPDGVASLRAAGSIVPILDLRGGKGFDGEFEISL